MDEMICTSAKDVDCHSLELRLHLQLNDSSLSLHDGQSLTTTCASSTMLSLPLPSSLEFELPCHRFWKETVNNMIAGS